MAASQQNMQNMFSALDRLKQGVADVQFRRVLNNANQAVEQVRAAEMQEAEKLQEIQNIANQFAVQAVGLQPASTVQTAQKAVGVTPFEAAQFQQQQQVEIGQQQADLELRNQAAKFGMEQQQKMALGQQKADLELRNESAKFGMEQQQQMQTAQMVNDLLGEKGAAGDPVEVQKAINLIPDPERRKDMRKRFVPGYGFALGDAQAVGAFRKARTGFKGAEKTINSLMELYEKEGVSGRFNPKVRARAKALSTALRGQLRIAIVGPGAVSKEEMALLEEVAANPFEMLSTFPQTRLQGLKDALNNKFQADLEALGLTDNTGRKPNNPNLKAGSAPKTDLKSFLRKRD